MDNINVDGWVNAHIHVVIPLAVTFSASDEVKAQALERVHDALVVPDGAVTSARWEDVNGEPSTVDPSTITQIVDWLKERENDMSAAPRDWLLIAKEIEKAFG
jgi:hypothetical protein